MFCSVTQTSEASARSQWMLRTFTAIHKQSHKISKTLHKDHTDRQESLNKPFLYNCSDNCSETSQVFIYERNQDAEETSWAQCLAIYDIKRVKVRKKRKECNL